jgi:hypothetical protein
MTGLTFLTIMVVVQWDTFQANHTTHLAHTASTGAAVGMCMAMGTAIFIIAENIGVFGVLVYTDTILSIVRGCKYVVR